MKLSSESKKSMLDNDCTIKELEAAIARKRAKALAKAKPKPLTMQQRVDKVGYLYSINSTSLQFKMTNPGSVRFYHRTNELIGTYFTAGELRTLAARCREAADIMQGKK